MARKIAIFLVICMTAAGPATAGISLLGLKNSLVQFALDKISTPDEFEITAESVEEPEDGSTRLVGVQISDSRGAWFKAEAISVIWNSSRLLSGELEITSLAASGVEVLRRPTPAGVNVEVKPDSEEPEESGSWLDWPRSPLTTRIDELRLDRVSVAAGVIAEQSLAFDAVGAARDEGDEQSVKLALKRTDETAGAIDFEYIRTFKANTLGFKLEAQEAAGGLVAEMAGLPAGSDSRVFVDAAGPLNDWKMTFAAAVAEMMDAKGQATVSLDNPIAIDAGFQFVPGPLLDAPLQTVLSPQADFSLKIREDAKGLIEIERGEFKSPELNLTATGNFAQKTGLADLAIVLEGRAGLATLADGVEFTGFGFDGSLKGTIDDLKTRGALSLEGLKTAPLDVGTGTLQTVIALKGGRVEFNIDGLIAGTRIDRLSPELVGEATIQAVGVFENNIAQLEHLRLRSPLLSADTSGRVELDQQQAEVTYKVTTDELGAIAQAYGADASGSLDISGVAAGPLDAVILDGQAALDNMTFDGEAYGQVNLRHTVRLTAEPSGNVELSASGSRYGPASIKTDFAMTPGQLVLSKMVADALEIHADGAVTLDLDSSLLDGDIQISAPDLGPVGEAAKIDITGSISGQVIMASADGKQNADLDLVVRNFSGFEASIGQVTLKSNAVDVLNAPRITADFDAATLSFQDLSAGRVGGSITATDVKNDPEITADITLEQAAGFDAKLGELKLKAEIENLLAGEKAQAEFSASGLAYQDVQVRGVTGNIAAGNFTASPDVSGKVVVKSVRGKGLALSSLTLEGDATNVLDAPAGNLRARANGLDAGGAQIARTDLTAKLAQTTTGRARLNAKVKTTAIEAAGARIESASVDAVVDNALSSTPFVAIKARTGAVKLDQVSLDGIDASVKGPLVALEATLSTSGQMKDGKPVEARLAARIDAAGKVIKATLKQAMARLEDDKIELQSPLDIRMPAGSTLLRGLNLAIPGGKLRGDLGLHPNGTSGDLALNMDDLDIARRLGGVPITQGRLDATARFDTRARGAGALVGVQARDLRFADIIADSGAIDFTLDANWDGARAEMKANLSGPFGAPVRIRANLPLVPSGAPAPKLPKDGQIDGGVTWAGDVGDFWALVPLPDHVLDGALDVDLTISGSLENPAAGGTIALTGGRYENLDLGTILTDLTVQSQVGSSGDFAVDLSAQDGANAPVTGKIVLSGDQVDVKLQTQNAILVRRDDIVAEVSADISVAGPVTGPAITGKVIIERAEARLVNATPPSVADLGEVRIKGEPVPEPKEPGTDAITLDLTISAPGNLFVRGRGLDSEWKMALDVGGTTAHPQVTGAIEKRRGNLSLIGRSFNLERGTITFSGVDPVDPLLDIAILRENEGITGGIVVSGPASAPEISFESVPALPSGEVLPRVLFGQSQQSLSGAQAIQLAAGLATLMSGSGGALDGIRSAAGVDVLRLDQDGDTASVTVGRNVADGVFVGASQPIDGGPAKIQVEVEIFDNITIDSEIGRDQGSSVGLNWKKNF